MVLRDNQKYLIMFVMLRCEVVWWYGGSHDVHVIFLYALPCDDQQ